MSHGKTYVLDAVAVTGCISANTEYARLMIEGHTESDSGQREPVEPLYIMRSSILTNDTELLSVIKMFRCESATSARYGLSSDDIKKAIKVYDMFERL